MSLLALATLTESGGLIHRPRPAQPDGGLVAGHGQAGLVRILSTSLASTSLRRTEQPPDAEGGPAAGEVPKTSVRGLVKTLQQRPSIETPAGHEKAKVTCLPASRSSFRKLFLYSFSSCSFELFLGDSGHLTDIDFSDGFFMRLFLFLLNFLKMLIVHVIPRSWLSTLYLTSSLLLII